MKKPTFIKRLIYALLFSVLISTNFGCKSMFNAELNGDQSIPFTKEGLLDLNKISEWIDTDLEPEYVAYRFPEHLLEGSAGFGLNSTEGESETSFCIGAGYNYRLSDDNYNRASYIGATASHHIGNADQYKLNRTQVGLQYNYYDRVTKNAELDLTYGIKASYETGSIENFGFTEDFTGITGSLLVGASFNLNEKSCHWSYGSCIITFRTYL